MIQINLLPWREELRAIKKRQFIQIAIVTTILMSSISYFMGLEVMDWIGQQESRNRFLSEQITSLNVEIKEILTLEEEREQLASRLEVIQQLQSSRANVVKIFDSLARIMPEGVYLDKLVRHKDGIILSGIAESNGRISILMRQIDESQDLGEAQLQIIERSETGHRFKIQAKEVLIDEENI